MLRGRRVVISFLVLALALFSASKSHAQYGQYGPYGGQPSKQIVIEKSVSMPGKSGEFVDNLSASDAKFSAGQEVTFKLVVRNTSDVELNDVVVTDFVPDFLVEISGQADINDEGNVVVNAGHFNAGEEKVYNLKFKVVSQDQLPQDQGVTCVVNKAQAQTGDVFDEDMAQFCIEKNVQGVTEVPATGPEMGLTLLASQLGLLGTGIFLRRKTK